MVTYIIRYTLVNHSRLASGELVTETRSAGTLECRTLAEVVRECRNYIKLGDVVIHGVDKIVKEKTYSLAEIEALIEVTELRDNDPTFYGDQHPG